MSKDASAELLEIENKISKIQERIERLEDYISDKWDEANSIKKKMFESFDDFNERDNAAYSRAVEFERVKQQEINQDKQEINQLEKRKKQLNDQLFAGLDESDDF